MRLWPRSLLGQVLATAALALLLAQAISGVLLYRASEERREAQMVNAAAFQLVAGDSVNRGAVRRRFRRALRQEAGRGVERARGLPPALRYQTSTAAPVSYPEADAEPALERRIGNLLAEQGVIPHSLAATIRRAGGDPAIREFAKARPRFDERRQWQNRRVLVAAIQRQEGGTWEVARALEPRRDQRTIPILLGQTALLFAVLLALLFFAMRRITRPLAALTSRVERFGGTLDAAPPLPPTGPADVRNLIAAHNAMETRISGLLDEKDVMLGAIGHDLKTPLAALRVRIESVEDEAERAKMADTIEDIAATLDDILTLARIGRAGTLPVRAELAALTASVVEEFEDMGETVSLGQIARIALPVHVTWIRRALRNLISNALRYGGAAEVSLLREGGTDGDWAVLQVSDSGPGIPADRIAEMLEPFTRGEISRNRATGGAGLGLTLARAIAEQHGGRLEITNRPEGGLCARIMLPQGEASA